MNKKLDLNMDTFGAFEVVSFPDLKINKVIAKIDTGAYSGAIHCAKIREIIKKDGTKVLKFQPINDKADTIVFDKYYITHVRSSTGHRIKRYLIDTDMKIKNKRYTVRIGLSDRSNMNKQVLIGRRFLRENNILINVKLNQNFEKNNGGK